MSPETVSSDITLLSMLRCASLIRTRRAHVASANSHYFLSLFAAHELLSLKSKCVLRQGVHGQLTEKAVTFCR